MEPPRSFDHTPALTPERIPRAVREAARRLAADPGSGYVYDPALAASRARELRGALPDWARVYFAVKSNGFGEVLAHLAEAVDGFETASLHEARSALTHLRDSAGGHRGRPIAVSGPGKSPEMLAGLTRLRAESGAEVVVNAESELELYRASAAAEAAGTVLPVTLRVNPERVPVRGALAMGGTPSPFGLPEPLVDGAVRTALSLPGLDLIGFHVHAVSGNTDAVAHAAYVRWCLEWARRTADAHGVDLRVVDVGGGLGVPFEEEDEAFDVKGFGAALAELPDPGVEVVFEPGRWIAAPAGWYAARVTDIKSAYGLDFAVVRGGINHFQLPTSWEIRHNFAVVAEPSWPEGMPRPRVDGASVTISGELCTPEDVLARDVRVEALRAGDTLVFPNAGAYGHEFAMPAFLAHPSAPRVSVDSSEPV
ncbi:diaminopimelate decarboxylase [Nocardiopsis terrae]|uniref:Diaminopimelate decarboxylase n=1 Tax=Nocardiopsis terrae TaxID=372655 RepID=A0ABR9HG66_9ACTN|nr:alanine racemase [Nocardiopsis terrae]MBE1457952.1 diaminopimelate decarboxylase [Nocardiopsis terrae]GHC83342.1 diaminopimelate decarboxylase [Nocardiopsis terrae]